MKEQETGLPEGWEYKSILSLIPDDGIISDGDWIESKDQDINGDVRLIQLADIGDGLFKNKSQKFLTSKRAKELNCTYLKNNDILIARMPDPIGRACIFPDVGQDSVTAVDVCIIRLGKKPKILTELLVYWINSLYIRHQMEMESTGTTRKRITRKKIENFKVPLPPLPEQQHLSQKLTALLDGVAEAKQRLEKIPALLKQFRQSVLADAVSGKLTEEWRVENGYSLSEGKIADFVTFSPKKDKLEDDLSVSFSSMHLMSENVSEHLTFEEKQWKDVKKGFTFFKDNDVLLAKITPCFENGKSAVARNLINGIGAGSTEFMVFRCNEEILPEYLYFNLNTDNFRQNGALNMSGSVGHKRVPKEFVLNWEIILPSLPEQTQIIQKVETYFALADKIETEAANALEKVNLLTQSILAKAFRGELSADWRAENNIA